MSLIEVNWNPSHKQLRSFGVAALIAAPLISLLLYLVKGVSIYWIITILAVGIIIFISSRISLKITKVFYLALMTAAMPIGFVVSITLLTIFYFLLLMPLGLLFRLIGRDPLCRRFDPGADSYWMVHRQPESLDRYFHQF